MTSRTDRATLIRLLQQLAPMQRGLCNQCIVIILPEAARTMQRACNTAYSLKLRTGITYTLLVHGERLREELIRDLLEASLVSDLTGREEQAEAVFCNRGGGCAGGGTAGCGACVEGGEEGVEEFV